MGLSTFQGVKLLGSGLYVPASVFTPDQINGNILWIDGASEYKSRLFQDDAGTTPVENDGDVVGLAQDGSPAGNDITQPSTAAKMLWRSADGGYLETDGVDDFLGRTVSYATAFTLVSRHAHIGGNNKFGSSFSSYNSGAAGSFQYDRSASADTELGIRYNTSATLSFGVGGYSATERVFTTRSDNSTVTELRVNGVSAGSSISVVGQFNRFRLGLNRSGIYFAQMNLKFLAIYDSYLSDEDLEQVEAYRT